MKRLTKSRQISLSASMNNAVTLISITYDKVRSHSAHADDFHVEYDRIQSCVHLTSRSTFDSSLCAHRLTRLNFGVS